MLSGISITVENIHRLKSIFQNIRVDIESIIEDFLNKKTYRNPAVKKDSVKVIKTSFTGITIKIIVDDTFISQKILNECINSELLLEG